MKNTDLAKDILQKNSIVNTPQRLQVLEVLYAKGVFMSAEDIYKEVKRTRSGVSQKTVYNTLKFFVELNLVSRHRAIEDRSIFYCSQDVESLQEFKLKEVDKE